MACIQTVQTFRIPTCFVTSIGKTTRNVRRKTNFLEFISRVLWQTSNLKSCLASNRLFNLNTDGLSPWVQWFLSLRKVSCRALPLQIFHFLFYLREIGSFFRLCLFWPCWMFHAILSAYKKRMCPTWNSFGMYMFCFGDTPAILWI